MRNEFFWRRVGVLLTFFSSFFLLFDAIGKLVQPNVVVEATVRLGFPASLITGIGVALLVCTLLYLVPWTSLLGAVLLTGYLGGAVATHVRAETGTFTVVFPVVVAAMVWAGLILRRPPLRRVLFSKE